MKYIVALSTVNQTWQRAVEEKAYLEYKVRVAYLMAASMAPGSGGGIRQIMEGTHVSAECMLRT